MYVSAAWQEISFIVHLNAEHFSCKYQAIIQRLQKKKMPPDPFFKAFSLSRSAWFPAEMGTKYVVGNLKAGRGTQVVCQTVCEKGK